MYARPVPLQPRKYAKRQGRENHHRFFLISSSLPFPTLAPIVPKIHPSRGLHPRPPRGDINFLAPRTFVSLSPTLLLPRHPPPWWLCMRGPPPSSTATAALTLSKSVPGRYSWNTVAGERVRFVRNVSICPMDFTAPEEKY